jgi:hypothetical protein
MYNLSFCVKSQACTKNSDTGQALALTSALCLVERKAHSKRYPGFLIKVTVAPQHRICTDFPVLLRSLYDTLRKTQIGVCGTLFCGAESALSGVCDHSG